MTGIVTDIVEQLAHVGKLHVIWFGLGVLTLALLLMLVTRWGESKAVGKCLMLSLLGHCLLGVYATTVNVVAQERTVKVEEATFKIERLDVVDPLDPGKAVSEPTAVWDRFMQRGPMEELAIQTPRPDVPEAPPIQREAPPSEIPPERPRAEVSLDAATLPMPGQLVQSQTRAEAVSAESAAMSEAPVPQRQDPGETPLPGRRETRLRPDARLEAPSRRAARSKVETPFSDPLVRHLRRQQAEQPGPTAARTDTVDVPSRRGGALEPLAPLENTVDPVPVRSESATAAARPAVPASPSLRLRPGPSALSGPTLLRRSRAPSGALVEQRLVSPSPFPLAGRSERLRPTPEHPHAAQPAPSSVPFRNRARLPAAYRLRTAPNRRELAVQRGGSEESERAVEDALNWLARHQSADGRWDADGFDRNCPANDRCSGVAGLGGEIDGQDRSTAGRTADTGMTALALLVFLGAGHTHREGPYMDVVGRGLEWLLSRQARDGNLAGDADTFAFMYCHGMATLALGEAYGMTGDSRLIDPLQRAVQFTVGMQDRATGGWRYRLSRQGDTSVLGWQVMALKSAEQAGVAVPPQTWQQARQFLRSVASGRFGGLASYRPREAVKASMTAEALACRQLLGRPRNDPASEEAVQYVLRNRPDSTRYNLYYWYYGTLSLYHQGGPAWETWNRAMRDTLVGLQSKQGSWEPISHWSPHGGRVYSTAMATLCLEVYYRYLPLYLHLEVPVTRNGAGRSPSAGQ
jgi:hypothetical protein